jgi:hypothetical protein
VCQEVAPGAAALGTPFVRGRIWGTGSRYAWVGSGLITPTDLDRLRVGRSAHQNGAVTLFADPDPPRHGLALGDRGHLKLISHDLMTALDRA